MITDLLLNWRTLAILVVTYCFIPYTVLWLIVRCWPKDHPRRAEYLAEYDVIPTWRRPFWVGDAAIRSILDGTAQRVRVASSARGSKRRTKRLMWLKRRLPSRTRRSKLKVKEFPIEFEQGVALSMSDEVAEAWKEYVSETQALRGRYLRVDNVTDLGTSRRPPDR